MPSNVKPADVYLSQDSDSGAGGEIDLTDTTWLRPLTGSG